METADPDIVIEHQEPGFVVYQRKSTGARWSVRGVCDRRGDCLIGSVVKTDYGPVRIRNHEHLEALKRQIGRYRIDSELDVPVTPGFEDCCEFEIEELDGN